VAGITSVVTGVAGEGAWRVLVDRRYPAESHVTLGRIRIDDTGGSRAITPLSVTIGLPLRTAAAHLEALRAAIAATLRELAGEEQW
jgi:hypothetical protein